MTFTDTMQSLTLIEIQRVPEVEGVYELADSSRLIIYIGRSVNLQKRLNEHLLTTDTCLKLASYFQYEQTLSSEAREREMLEDYRRIHGRLPRCNDVI